MPTELTITGLDWRDPAALRAVAAQLFNRRGELEDGAVEKSELSEEEA